MGRCVSLQDGVLVYGRDVSILGGVLVYTMGC